MTEYPHFVLLTSAQSHNCGLHTFAHFLGYQILDNSKNYPFCDLKIQKFLEDNVQPILATYAELHPNKKFTIVDLIIRWRKIGYTKAWEEFIGPILRAHLLKILKPKYEDFKFFSEMVLKKLVIQRALIDKKLNVTIQVLESIFLRLEVLYRQPKVAQAPACRLVRKRLKTDPTIISFFITGMLIFFKFIIIKFL
ncbi:MAG: hypothetical protein JWM09_207 [Francisellaceae bacterium]|nr:hypothetical protein [Francisellaceae bacterium]